MKNNKPIRIAQIMTEMNYGGVEMVIMNYYRHIDKSKYQFDFFVLEGSQIPQKAEIEAMGGRIFVVPHYKNLISYQKTLVKYFRKNKYQIVHSNMNTLSVFSLSAAWTAGVPVRICHNHSTAGKGETKKNIIKYILRPFAKIFPTNLCACSEYAGKWIFGRNTDFRVFNNAIKLSDFTYNPSIRKQLRQELNLKGKFVIGHVGRFCYQKNHEFLIDIFKEICKIHKNSVLILIGEGETEKAVRRKVRRLGLEKKVMFLGKQSDVCKYYQAMDLFLLPSRYEGLPVVAVEAQATGLPCVLSDVITPETKILDSTVFVNNNSSPEMWAEKVLKLMKNFRRKDSGEKMKNAGFCIENEAGKLADFYDELIREFS